MLRLFVILQTLLYRLHASIKKAALVLTGKNVFSLPGYVQQLYKRKFP